MKKLFLVGLVLMWLGTQTSQAQNMANTRLMWTVDGLNDLSTNQSVAYHCTFTTNGSEPIIWSQNDGKFISNILVRSLSGEWVNVGEPGKIVYTVSINGQIGTLSFERNAQVLQITLDMPRANGKKLNHRYMVVNLK